MFLQFQIVLHAAHVVLSTVFAPTAAWTSLVLNNHEIVAKPLQLLENHCVWHFRQDFVTPKCVGQRIFFKDLRMKGVKNRHFIDLFGVSCFCGGGGECSVPFFFSDLGIIN